MMPEFWTPLVKAEPVLKTKAEVQQFAKEANMTYKEAKDGFKKDETAEWWKNHLYTVIKNILDEEETPCVWLSIRRNDRQPVTNWRHKQYIKNQLVGPECEGLELYPAESRLVDNANQYHLWCFTTPNFRIPFGFDERMVSATNAGGSKQEPFDEK